MNGAGGKIASEFERPIVGRELHLGPERAQRRGKRGGRKEMAAGAPGGQQYAPSCVHSAATR